MLEVSGNLFKWGLELPSAACITATNKSKCLDRQTICGRLPDLGVRGVTYAL